MHVPFVKIIQNPCSTFRFNLTFLLLCINLATLCEHMYFERMFSNIYISYQKSSHAELFLHLLLLSCWGYFEYIVAILAEFSKNLTRRDHFSNFFHLLLSIHVQIYFNMLVNFEKIFF